jgi:hypothetical protein
MVLAMRTLLNEPAGKQGYHEKTRIFAGSLEFTQGMFIVHRNAASAQDVCRRNP